MNKIGRFGLTAGLLAMASVGAQASIIYNLTSVTPSGSNFDWQYTAQLSADQMLGPTSSTGTPTNDFAVVYDFLGVISASTSGAASGLTLSTVLETITAPQPSFQNVPDSAALLNVRTNITGTLVPTGMPITIYTIDIISTSGSRGNFAFQSAQALKNVPGDPSNGGPAGNTTLVEAPVLPVGTPEPATMALMGSSLIGLGFLRKRVKK